MSSIISQPDVTVNIVSAVTDVSNTPQKVLFVGQKLPAGTAPSGDLVENISTNTATINGLFGRGSILAQMVIEAKRQNVDVQFDAIPLDDAGAAVAALSTITFTGTATDTGTYVVAIGSPINHEFTVPVAVGDTQTDIGDALAALVNADLDCPMTAANATGTVTLTARNGGTLGNSIGIRAEGEAAGTTIAFTGTAGGSVDPDLSTVLDAVGVIRYQTVVWPYPADVDTVATFLDDRFNATDNILDGVAVTAQDDTLANLLTAGNTLNSQSVVYFGDLNVATSTYNGSVIFEMPWIKVSQFAAVRSLRLTDGSSIARYVISRNGARDSFGGPALASKPYFNTPMTRLTQAVNNLGFSRSEIEQLHDAGVSVIGGNRTQTNVILGEVVTTYKTDVAANPDISFKYLNYVDTSSNAREYFANNLRARFAQSRLTEGDLVRGRDMANPELISAVCVGLYSDLAGPDFVLVQAGEAALQFFKQNLDVTVDLSTGTATINMVTPLVTQLREILATMQISFSTNG